jgi:hypothetical protein
MSKRIGRNREPEPQLIEGERQSGPPQDVRREQDRRPEHLNWDAPVRSDAALAAGLLSPMNRQLCAKVNRPQSHNRERFDTAAAEALSLTRKQCSDGVVHGRNRTGLRSPPAGN